MSEEKLAIEVADANLERLIERCIPRELFNTGRPVSINILQAVYEAPYTYVSVSFNGRVGHGFAKRCPRDAPDIEIGVPIALRRALDKTVKRRLEDL
jgi:hypothetical protein